MHNEMVPISAFDFFLFLFVSASLCFTERKMSNRNN